MSSSEVSLRDMLRPMPGKVAVLVATKSERTPSGLFIPEETARSVHEERATQGEVVALGDGVDDVDLGDVVIFGKYSGTKIKWKPKLAEDATESERIAHNKLEAETVIIMTETSILTVLLTPEEASNLKVRG